MGQQEVSLQCSPHRDSAAATGALGSNCPQSCPKLGQDRQPLDFYTALSSSTLTGCPQEGVWPWERQLCLAPRGFWGRTQPGGISGQPSQQLWDVPGIYEPRRRVHCAPTPRNPFPGSGSVPAPLSVLGSVSAEGPGFCFGSPQNCLDHPPIPGAWGPMNRGQRVKLQCPLASSSQWSSARGA